MLEVPTGISTRQAHSKAFTYHIDFGYCVWKETKCALGSCSVHAPLDAPRLPSMLAAKDGCCFTNIPILCMVKSSSRVSTTSSSGYDSFWLRRIHGLHRKDNLDPAFPVVLSFDLDQTPESYGRTRDSI